jgi:hypothetical protein
MMKQQVLPRKESLKVQLWVSISDEAEKSWVGSAGIAEFPGWVGTRSSDR